MLTPRPECGRQGSSCSLRSRGGRTASCFWPSGEACRNLLAPSLGLDLPRGGSQARMASACVGLPIPSWQGSLGTAGGLWRSSTISRRLRRWLGSEAFVPGEDFWKWAGRSDSKTDISSPQETENQGNQRSKGCVLPFQRIFLRVRRRFFVCARSPVCAIL